MQRSSDKTVPIPDPDSQREFALQQIHLRFKRGEVEPAFRAICRVRASSKYHPDIEQLYAEIVSIRGHERVARKDREDQLRQIRYYLGLQTSWSRMCWWLVGIALVCYAMWDGSRAVGQGVKLGFSTEITTMVERGGRYTRHLEPWTRPIYYDVIYSSLFLLLGGVAMLTVYKVGKGAFQWEELDADSGNSGAYYRY
jgi:hypothetical protein